MVCHYNILIKLFNLEKLLLENNTMLSQLIAIIILVKPINVVNNLNMQKKAFSLLLIFTYLFKEIFIFKHLIPILDLERFKEYSVIMSNHQSIIIQHYKDIFKFLIEMIHRQVILFMVLLKIINILKNIQEPQINMLMLKEFLFYMVIYY